VTTLALVEQQSDVLATLRRLKGRGTLGDIVSDSGLSSDDVRAALKSLLESHRGHLAVSDSGELVYDFDAKFIERGTEPLLARLKKAITSIVTRGFKAWIVVMLVVYFVVFVVLVIYAVFGKRQGGDTRGGWSKGRAGHRGGGFHFNPLISYWIWSPRWRIGRPYYGHRWERTLDKGDTVPFYKKVFAFVFGPDQPNPSQSQLDRGKLRLIRARKGVLTTAGLVEYTGSTFAEAENEMGRLLGAYDGEVAVSPDGELVYAFPGVVASVNDRSSPRAPNPTWMRLEPARELTGNTLGANAAVVGMNAFTLIASATAPWFIFPRLGLEGFEATVALVLVPVVFSFLFFTGPLLRMVGVRLENRRRKGRNVRRVLLGLVYERALGKGEGVRLDEAIDFVRSRLKKETVTRPAIESVLHALAAELDAGVSADDDGELRFTFDAIRSQVAAGEVMRRTLSLDERRLGDIVFSTSDSSEAEDARELRLFDRTLAADDLRLGQYMPSLDRVDFEDEYELIAFDEELKSRGLGAP
jgi:hypothetical protein